MSGVLLLAEAVGDGIFHKGLDGNLRYEPVFHFPGHFYVPHKGILISVFHKNKIVFQGFHLFCHRYAFPFIGIGPSQQFCQCQQTLVRLFCHIHLHQKTYGSKGIIQKVGIDLSLQSLHLQPPLLLFLLFQSYDQLLYPANHLVKLQAELSELIVCLHRCAHSQVTSVYIFHVSL